MSNAERRIIGEWKLGRLPAIIRLPLADYEDLRRVAEAETNVLFHMEGDVVHAIGRAVEPC